MWSDRGFDSMAKSKRQLSIACADSHLQGVARCISTARGLAAPARTRRSGTGIAVPAAVLVAKAFCIVRHREFGNGLLAPAPTALVRSAPRSARPKATAWSLRCNSWVVACLRSRCRCYLPMVSNVRHRASDAQRRVLRGASHELWAAAAATYGAGTGAVILVSRPARSVADQLLTTYTIGIPQTPQMCGLARVRFRVNC